MVALPRRRRAHWLVAIGVSTAWCVPAAATANGDDEAPETAGTHFAKQGPPTSSLPASDVAPTGISLAGPIGSVSIAQPGDDLGSTRRGYRSSRNGVVTLQFNRPLRMMTRATPAESLPEGMPVDGARLTSQFGYRNHPISGRYRIHSGVDLAASQGTPIVATSGGRVISSGWMGGYGIVVRLDHGKGMETRYAHMSRSIVAADQSVQRGQVIGYVGSTGRSTGPHLHYEIRQDGRAVDPLR